MKYIITLFIALCSVTGAMAQEYKTNVSMRSQVLHGTVPGAQYRDVTSSKPQSAGDKQESLGNQIKNNKEPGKQYKKDSGASSAKSKTASARTGSESLASEKKAEKIEPVATPAVPQNLTQ